MINEEEEIIPMFEEICKRHPEYTEKQQQCVLYSLYAGKACDVCDERIRQKYEYNQLLKDHPTFVGFKEGTLRPLINEQDPQIKQKVISQIENARPQERKRLHGTEEKMKKTITRAKGEKPANPQKKVLCDALSLLSNELGFTDKLRDGIRDLIEEKYGK